MPFNSTTRYIKYTDLYYGQKTYYEIIKELNPRNLQINTESAAHLDPDIRYSSLVKRHQDWKPVFGQLGAAQGHLKNQGVSPGDLFLFFGWFRQTELINGKLRYKLGSPDLHIIYGYLQVDKILASGDSLPDFAMSHVHGCANYTKHPSNCLYVGKDALTFNDNLKGADTFNFSERLILTKKGMTKGKWELPDFFIGLDISYHTQRSFIDGYFKSAGKGQEFVIQADPRLTDWVNMLMESRQ